jgi:hypothetical protein
MMPERPCNRRPAGLTGARRFRVAPDATIVLQVHERIERQLWTEPRWIADGTRWRDARIEDLTEHEAPAA